MLDLAYVTLLDFLSRSPPLRYGRDEVCEARFVPIVGEGKDSREEAAPPDVVGDRLEKSSRAQLNAQHCASEAGDCQSSGRAGSTTLQTKF
jgi:hypothetical protein